MAGFLGISALLFINLGHLCYLKSFGVSYISLFLPFSMVDGSISYFIPPIFKREHRANFLNTKKEHSQEKISMKWKFKKGI